MEARSVPLHEEVATVAKRTVERRARIDKKVRTRTETIETVLRREQPAIERIPINREVSEVPAVRQEGDTFVIPVLEEIAVIERCLVLREEIRIRRHEIVEPFRQDVTLRVEEVVVDASPRDGEAIAPSTHTIKQGKDD
ncbi:MAG TPA: DUF2382 domain-containing protein [Alphaproteobacteria bacterium]|nr:DUF2382 domain-containing protein [Alphaproteobacteria bacterium]